MEHALLILIVVGFFAMQAWSTFLSTWLPTIHKKFAGATAQEEELSKTSSAKAPRNDSVVDLMRPLPADICGRIACLAGFQGVAELGTCCKPFQSQFWDSPEVWMALPTNAQLPCPSKASGSSCTGLSASGWDARQDFRRAFFRTDLSRLRSLAAVGRTGVILEESAHVAQGLLPGDLPAEGLGEFIDIAQRCLGAHDPESPNMVLTAERLLRAARRCMELFTEEQLENLEYAYRSVHQLHSLMMTSMKDSHINFLEESYWFDETDNSPDIPADDFTDFYEMCEAESSY